MTNKEKAEILKKYFTDNYDRIDLSDIDLGESILDLSGIKAKYIYNTGQKAIIIHNKDQMAKIDIYNSGQKAKEIVNVNQESKKTYY